MVILIDILVQNFTKFFFRFYLGIFWFYLGVLCCLVESWRSVIQGKNNYYNSNVLSENPFSLLNIVSDIAMGLDVAGFSSPIPYPCRPCRAYRTRLYMQL